MRRGTKATVAVCATAVLFLSIYAYRTAGSSGDHMPYPAGPTIFSYAGSERQESGGQDFAIFKFGNGEGVRVRLEGTIMNWDEEAQDWKERQWDLGLLPARRVQEIKVGQPGKWWLKVRAYARPSLKERIRARFTGERAPGGLIGAWLSPEMRGSQRSTNGGAIQPSAK